MASRSNIVSSVLAVVLVMAGACHAANDDSGPPVVKLGNRADLAPFEGRVVTVEGFFYDGSIPMLVNDMKAVAADSPIPQDAYVPLVGPLPPGLSWGDLVRATGMVRPPGDSDPPEVADESLVLAVPGEDGVRVVARRSS